MPARATASGPPRSGLPANVIRPAGGRCPRPRAASSSCPRRSRRAPPRPRPPAPRARCRAAPARARSGPRRPPAREQRAHRLARVAPHPEVGLDHGGVGLHLGRRPRRRSCGRSSSTLTWSETRITRLMWCSTSRIVSARSSRSRRMKSPSSSTSSWLSPPAGSSSRSKRRLRHQRARDLDPLLRPVRAAPRRAAWPGRRGRRCRAPRAPRARRRAARARARRRGRSRARSSSGRG